MDRDGLVHAFTNVSNKKRVMSFLCCLVDYFLISYNRFHTSLYPTPPFSLFPALLYVVAACFIFLTLHRTLHNLVRLSEFYKHSLLMRLRLLLVYLTILATCHNLVYHALLSHEFLHLLWRWQWFFTDGAWVIFRLVFWIGLMVGENSDCAGGCYSFDQYNDWFS